MATLDWPGTLVETGWLEEHLGHPELRIIDIRGEVKSILTEDGKRRTEYSAARGDYDAGHIPGAQFVDWTKDIVDLDDPIHRRVFAARPGITGTAQLEYRNEADLLVGGDPERRYREEVQPAKLQLDLDYLDRQSILVDLRILIRTVAVVFTR